MSMKYGYLGCLINDMLSRDVSWTCLRRPGNPRRTLKRWFTVRNVWTRGWFTPQVVTRLEAGKPQAKSQIGKVGKGGPAAGEGKKKLKPISYLFDANLAREDGYSPAYHEHWPRASKSINYTKSCDESAHFSRWKQRGWWKLHASRWASSLLGILVLSVVEPIVQDLRHGSRYRWMACACVWFPRRLWTCKCMSILRSTVLNAELSLIAVDSNLNSWRLSVKLGDWKLEGRRVS